MFFTCDIGFYLFIYLFLLLLSCIDKFDLIMIFIYTEQTGIRANGSFLHGQALNKFNLDHSLLDNVAPVKHTSNIFKMLSLRFTINNIK